MRMKLSESLAADRDACGRIKLAFVNPRSADEHYLVTLSRLEQARLREFLDMPIEQPDRRRKPTPYHWLGATAESAND